VAPDAQNDPRLIPVRDLLRDQSVASLMILPIVVEDEVIGSLSLETDQPRSFSAEEVNLAWNVADQVSGVLTRIRINKEWERAEAEVRESEERFRQVIASISDHIYLSEITTEGQRINRYISPNVETLTGYPVARFMADADFWSNIVIHPQDQTAAADQLHSLKLGQNSEIEYRLIRADGQVIWVRDSSRVHEIDHSKMIYGVVSNINRYKNAEAALLEERALLSRRVAERTAELRAANAQLARAARLKDEFLASMSHELRTPLNAILGMAEILREQIYGSLNDQQTMALGHIEEGGRHLLDLINDILDLSKIEAGKLELSLDSVLIEPVCEASLRFIKQMAQKKNIRVSFSLDQNLTTIQADERRLKQILVNLLTNAVKFTPEGGAVSLEVSGDKSLRVVYFTVRDSGIGIAKEEIAYLFKPFVQLDSKLSRQHEGTGLGLSLVSRLAEMHGGSVTIESVVGQGSSFMVLLPWTEDPATRPVSIFSATGAVSDSQLYPDRVSLEQILILLAEDNEANIRTIVDYLEAKGYRMTIARNGIQAVQQVQEEQPDLVLMDIQMPVMDGLEATRQIRANKGFAQPPIIALTGLAMSGDRESCLAVGVNEYVSKPVNLKRLDEMIKTLLASKLCRKK
jgi:PAS domain S-box-containing protein